MIKTCLFPKLSNRYPKKRAFITGCGSGLGKAMCLQLAADGWTLGINDRDSDSLMAVSELVRSAGGVASTYVFDVGDQGGFEQAADAFLKDNSGIDLLVNNAGLGAGANFLDFSLEHWHALIDVNIKGVIYGTRCFLPAMLRQDSAHIVNVASAAAYHSFPFISAYNMTKAAVVSLSESLHAELSETGVDISVMISAFYQSNLPEYTLGGELGQKRARGMCKNAGMTADEAAALTLLGVEKNNFYIIMSKPARLIYFLKRHFPNYYLKIAPKIARLAFARAERTADLP